METLIIEASSIECSEERREISGKIVPMGTGEIGNTNMGGVVFEAGSIDIADVSKIKLLSQHDMKKPVGRMIAAETRADGIYATFKLSRSNAGTESLILAQEGLVSGLSVGAEVIASKPSRDGHLVVTAAKLKEVSLVTEPAFKSAQVTQIAASEETDAATSAIDVAIQQLQNAPEETAAVEVLLDSVKQIIDNIPTTESEPNVEETTQAQAPAVEAAAVEAARPTVAAAFTVRERTAPISSAQYLEASMKAALGDDEARRTVRAADDSTSTNTGLTLPSHLNTFITDTFTGRPAFEAATRGSLAGIDGMSFTVPRLYVNASTADVAPTVADTNEGAAPSETGMTSAYDTISIEKFSGLQRVSFELVDRSSPAFMELMMAELRKAYEKATDAALLAAFVANGTTATGVAATAAGLQSFVSVEGAAAYKGTGGDFANKLVASTDQWAAIAGYADTTGRALYSAQGATQNASGNAVATSVVGGVLGTDLIVDHNISTSGIIDNSAFLVAPSSVYTWESPTTQLRVNVLTSGEIEINLYGYLAIYLAKSGKGVRKFNLS
jgi:HK97 family phage prohead protease/HK97 family phage major capsid protein